MTISFNIRKLNDKLFNNTHTKKYVYEKIEVTAMGYKVITQNKDMKISTFIKICNFLNESPAEFFETDFNLQVNERLLEYKSENIYYAELQYLKQIVKIQDQLIKSLQSKNEKAF